MDVTFTLRSPALSDVEIVERKGLGHPDTICDSIAEAVSVALSRHYLERFGAILHHNVDKVLLVGGASRPAFGGGEVVSPMEIYIGGRAVDRVDNDEVPLRDIALEAARSWLREHLRNVDPQRHARVHVLIRPGSVDLQRLWRRGTQAPTPLANDTSCGVGFAPLSDLERVVLDTERLLNDPRFLQAHPEGGEDVKVMGARCGERVDLTVARAFVDRHVAGEDAYAAAKARLAEQVECFARERLPQARVVVNAADDPAQGAFYLTVTGTSAEAGDDGEVGRGNRANGLITPCRPMSLEATAGKNPVSHVGKLYNVAARRCAERIVTELDGVERATCYMLSRIGAPIDDPSVVYFDLETHGVPEASLQKDLDRVAAEEAAAMPSLWHAALRGELSLF